MADEYLKDYSSISAIGGAAKGFMDAWKENHHQGEVDQDRQMKKMEFEARMKADQAKIDREAAQTAIENRRADQNEKNQEAQRKNDQEKADFELAKSGKMRDPTTGAIVDRPRSQREMEDASREDLTKHNYITEFDPVTGKSTSKLNPEYIKMNLEKAKVQAGLDPFGTKKLGAQKEQLAIDKATREASAEKLGKSIPASEAVAFGSADASQTALDDALAAVQKNPSIVGPYQGYLSKAAGAFEIGEKGKAAKTLQAQLKVNAQTIGRYLEGGKLAEGDINRYLEMLPGLNDSENAIKRKTELLKNLIATKRAAEIASLKAAGYNTSGLDVAPKSGLIQATPLQRATSPGKLGAEMGLSAEASPSNDPNADLSKMSKEQLRAWIAKQGGK